MRLVADRDDLLRPLKRVSGAIVRSSKIPITTNVLIEVVGATVKLTGTDLDMQISATAALKVGEDGAITVPAFLLLDILNRLPNGEVQIAAGKADGYAVLTSGRSRCRLPVTRAGDFPLFAPVKSDAGGQVLGPELAHLIDKTRFAISEDATRYILCGLYLDVTGEGEWTLRASAADKNRLARASVPVEATFQKWPGVAIPTRAVDEIRRMLDGAEIVSLRATPAMVAVETAGATLVTKVIDNPFRDHDRLLAHDAPHHFEVSVEDFRRSIRLALAATDNKAEPLIALDVWEGCAAVSAGGVIGQRAADEIESTYAGEPIMIGLNGQRILAALDCIEAATVRIAYGRTDTVVFLIDPDNPEVVSMATTARVNSFARPEPIPEAA